MVLRLAGGFSSQGLGALRSHIVVSPGSKFGRSTGRKTYIIIWIYHERKEYIFSKREKRLKMN